MNKSTARPKKKSFLFQKPHFSSYGRFPSGNDNNIGLVTSVSSTKVKRALVLPGVLKLQTGPGHLGSVSYGRDEKTKKKKKLDHDHICFSAASMWRSHSALGGIGTDVKGSESVLRSADRPHGRGCWGRRR